jgi:DhnA family fructose-bisphosphate aldolase class Ia
VVSLAQVLHHHCRAGELLEGALLLAQVRQAYGVVDDVVGTIVIAVGATCMVSAGRQQQQQTNEAAAAAAARDLGGRPIVWWMTMVGTVVIAVGATCKT